MESPGTRAPRWEATGTPGTSPSSPWEVLLELPSLMIGSERAKPLPMLRCQQVRAALASLWRGHVRARARRSPHTMGLISKARRPAWSVCAMSGLFFVSFRGIHMTLTGIWQAVKNNELEQVTAHVRRHGVDMRGKNGTRVSGREELERVCACTRVSICMRHDA